MMGRVFSKLFPPHGMVDSKSVLGNEPCDSGVVNGYQVDEFTHNWSAQHIVAQSHIYPGFMDQLSTLTHLVLESACEDCFFLDQAVKNLEHGLGSTITHSINTPELDASFDEADTCQSFCTWLVPFLIFTDHSLHLASNLVDYGASLGKYFACTTGRYNVGL